MPTEPCHADKIMPQKTRVVSPGPSERSVRTDEGELLTVPKNWDLLPPGDAGLTRRVKAAGPTWTVKEKKGRRTFSRGVWAAREQIQSAQTKLQSERSTDAYAKRQQAAAQRREKKQHEYVGDFRGAVLAYLDFDSRYSEIANRLATQVTDHATPVGSGTVARTERIPIERRAESAVIAWLRHQTTAYDNMKIARVKGKRREVRRQLAAESKRLLNAYRQGTDIDPTQCPLQQALSG